jgi:hypothetical protein
MAGYMQLQVWRERAVTIRDPEDSTIAGKDGNDEAP